ncbi:MAG: sensor histidine kinase [Mariprofundus sp.]|nr:sensor histidine kinase [Mariprofundus sp.]
MNIRNHLSIRYRLLLLIILTLMSVVLLISYFTYQQFKQTISSQAVNHLKTIRDFRIHDLREALKKIPNDLNFLSQQPTIKLALRSFDPRDFDRGISAKSHIKATQLLAHYLSYYQEKSRFYDMFLISPGGDIFYSVRKESDLGTNLITGPNRESELANVFRRARFMLQEQTSEIAFYKPSGEAAIFLVAPVFEQNNIIGYLALQMDMSFLNQTVSLNRLLKSGEVITAISSGNKLLIVAPLRNHRLAAMKMTLSKRSNTGAALLKALQGEDGNSLLIDYRNIAVEAAWGYIPELKIALMVKIDSDELMAEVYALQRTIIIIVAIILLLSLIVVSYISRSITRPIEQLKKSVVSLVSGSFAGRCTIDATDEVGELAKAFNTMVDNIESYNRQINDQNSQLKHYGNELEKRVEERTATLAAANEDIKSFAYIVSHDLRSPLVNMKGFTGELDYVLRDISVKVKAFHENFNETDLQNIQQLIDDDIPEAMHFITTAVDKMDHMLSSILTLSRIGRRELHIEPVDLQLLCSDILTSFAFQLQQNHTKTVMGELPVILNDRIVIEQIMGNLIGNAVKYLDPEREGFIAIGAKVSDHGITISVEDNGFGILPQEADKVFLIFRRGIHQQVQGEGMGLAYVQTLVRNQGGSIKFSPAPQFGTIFTAFLPLQVQENSF